MKLIIFSLFLLFSFNHAHAQNKHVVNRPDGTRWEVVLVDGVPHGPSTTWHPNGVMASTGLYKNGQREGMFLFWNAAGKLVEKRNYNSETMMGDSSMTASGQRIPASTNNDYQELQKAESIKTTGYILAGIGVTSIIAGVITASQTPSSCQNQSYSSPLDIIVDSAECGSESTGNGIVGGLFVAMGAGFSITGISKISKGNAMESTLRSRMRLNVSGNSKGANATLGWSF